MKRTSKIIFILFNVILFIYSFSLAIAQTNKRTEIGYKILDIEKEEGFPVNEEEYLLLDSILIKAEKEIKTKKHYTKEEAIEILLQIGNIFKDFGIDYDYEKNQKLLNIGLKNKKFVCDMYIITYISISEAINLPIYPTPLPEHVLVLWKDKSNSIYWETKTSEAISKESLSWKYPTLPGYIKNGIYLFQWNNNDLLANAYINIGYEKSKLNKYEESMKYYDKALEISPDFYAAWINKLGVLKKLGKYEEGIKIINIAIERKPDIFELWFMKGFFLEKIGEKEEAKKCYNKVGEIEPNIAIEEYNRGKFRYESNNIEESIISFDVALRIKPDFVDAWNYKGYALINLGRYEEAIKCYDEAIVFKSDFYDAWLNKGTILNHLGRYEEAIKCYDEVIRIKPDLHTVWWVKACTYALMKNKKDMLETLKKAIKLNRIHKENATTNVDFKPYWNDLDFINLVK